MVAGPGGRAYKPRMSAPPAPATPRASVQAAAFIALVMGAIAMGVSPLFVRLADVGPFASAFWRAGLALPALYVWMLIEERGAGAGAPKPGFTLPVLLAGGFFAGDLFFWHLSILNTTIANSTFLATTAPIWVILVAWLWFGETIRRETWIGLVLCVGGGAALLGDSLRMDPARLLGDAYGLATGVFFGLYFQAVRVARATHGAARLTFQASIVTAACLLFVALALEPRILPRSAEGWGVVAALALVSHVGGQGLLAVALGHLPAVFSSLVIFIEAVFAAALAWIALGEALTLGQIAGGVAIMAGIWIARPRETTSDAP